MRQNRLYRADAHTRTLMREEVPTYATASTEATSNDLDA